MNSNKQNNTGRFNSNKYLSQNNKANNAKNGNRINQTINTSINMKNRTARNGNTINAKYNTEKILKYVLFGVLILLLLTGIGFGIYYLVRYIRKRQEVKEIAAENVKAVVIAKDDAPKEKEVYHVAENRFNYKNAKAVCKALGAELATPEQLVEAYKKGANWCSYGWTEGGHAYYPIQQDFYKRIQDDESCGLKDQCGVPGINGGYFDPTLKFGVNCYGVKRSATKEEENATKKKCSGDIELDNKVREYKQSLSDVMFAPFAPGKWSIA